VIAWRPAQCQSLCVCISSESGDRHQTVINGLKQVRGTENDELSRDVI
jgi:hypothetical protein